ncbi:MAG: hypothetical protein DSY80_09070 [Desulfocapsa sp.]|nr:MAG: hypothetical protein DSY80_09070 [Desulfocapsa sp.]
MHLKPTEANIHLFSLSIALFGAMISAAMAISAFDVNNVQYGAGFGIASIVFCFNVSLRIIRLVNLQEGNK